jgi:hypothetical protein
MGIEITFMNQSYNATYHVVIFQRNKNAAQDDFIAWQQLSSPAYSHTFHYPVAALPQLWIGAVQGIAKGQVLTAEHIQHLTAITLTGIEKADLIMTGGGWREPYKFTLLPR